MLDYPQFYKVKQAFPHPRVKSIEEAIKKVVRQTALADKISPGDEIAITAGSRGITNVVEILYLLGREIKALGGKPFLVAAMGSHGGGTGPGMLEILEGLGITANSINMPVKASDRVVHLQDTEDGYPVYCAEEAYSADGLIIVNRVKAHTSFRGRHESGLFKMLSVGLGRAPGADSVHKLGPADMARAIYETGNVVLKKAPVICGAGIVENANKETAVIQGCKPEEFAQADELLLEKARSLAPSLPAEQVDLLVVQEMGKDYSGTGMDTNVIGRYFLEGVSEPEVPRITRIAVLNLSEASHGNAHGIGLADFTTRHLFKAIDLEKTYLNGLTTNYLQRIKLPIIMPSDEQAVEKAWKSLRLENLKEARVIIIHDTLHLNELYISEALKEEVARLDNVTVEKECTLHFPGGKLELA